MTLAQYASQVAVPGRVTVSPRFPLPVSGVLNCANIGGSTTAKTIHKYGANSAVGTTTEDIWTVGGIYGGWLTVAEKIQIKAGGSADDDAGGLGARTIKVFGLDENFNEVSEVLTTAGVSAGQQSSAKFSRVYRALIETCGTYGGSNFGNVDIETVGGTLMARIDASSGQTEMGIFTVPAGKTGYIAALMFNVDSNKTVSFRGRYRERADVVTAPFGPSNVAVRIDVAAGPVPVPISAWPVLPEKTDFWIEGEAEAGSAPVSVFFDVLLVDN